MYVKLSKNYIQEWTDTARKEKKSAHLPKVKQQWSLSLPQFLRLYVLMAK